MKKMFATMLFLFCSCAYGQNAVIDWAAIVQPAVNNPPKPPAIQLVLRAIIQLAVYDAAIAIQGGFEPYGRRSRRRSAPTSARRSPPRPTSQPAGASTPRSFPTLIHSTAPTWQPLRTGLPRATASRWVRLRLPSYSLSAPTTG
jgi:hypothetical protein